MKWLVVLACFLLASLPALASLGWGGVVGITGNVAIVPTGVAQASIINTTASMPSSDTAIPSWVASRHVTVKSSPDAAIMYLDLAGGTATSADFRIEPGASFTYEGATLSSAPHILGASATGTYSVCAY